MVFFQVVAKNIFPGGGSSGEISFYQLKIERKTFSTKELIINLNIII